MAVRLLVAAAALAGAGTIAAQTLSPVINARGIVNLDTLQPAPTFAAPGGLLRIQGINLSPPEGATANGIPWPLKLADVEVLINNRPAPLKSVTPSEIICQIPWEIPGGQLALVVRRGANTSAPARLQSQPQIPGIRTENGLGFGPAAVTRSGRDVTLLASGLGLTDPRVENGDAGPVDEEARPRAEYGVYVDGIPVESAIKLAPGQVGAYEIRFTLPPDALPSDTVQLVGPGRQSNSATTGVTPQPRVTVLPLPQGLNAVAAINSPDLSGNYVVVNGPRNSEGCYPTVVYQFRQRRAAGVEDCVTAAGNQVTNPQTGQVQTNFPPSPFSVPGESPTMGAYVAPLEQQSNGVFASKVIAFHPALDKPRAIALPGLATALRGGAGGVLMVTMPSAGESPAKNLAIDPLTGEVAESAQQPAVIGAPQGAGGANPQATFKVTVDGVEWTPVSAPIQIGQQASLTVIVDSADRPRRAKLAALNARQEATATRDFPEGLLPLIPPVATPAQPQPGGQPVVGRAVYTVSAFFDGPSRVLFVPAITSDGASHAVAALPLDEAVAARALPAPEGWYIANCTAQTALMSLELSRRIAFYASRTLETQIRAQCPAQGYLIVNLANPGVTLTRLPGSGQLNATAGTADINDYLFGSNIIADRQVAAADTLFVMDSVSLNAFQISLSQNPATFVNLIPIADMNILVALGRNTLPGDEGVIKFDLERQEAVLLPTPDGFDRVEIFPNVGYFRTSRILLARGFKPSGAGSQYILYDLISHDSYVVPNPAGVVWAGGYPGVPAQPAQGGQPATPAQPGVNMQRLNPRANSFAAVGYNAQRRPVAVFAVNLP